MKEREREREREKDKEGIERERICKKERMSG